MSRYLAFDAEQDHLYLASAIVKGNAVKVEKAIALPKDWTVTAANAVELGRRIKELLKEANIAPAPVLVSLGRERVILKEVKYPASVTAAEEPALVRFQVAKELAEGADAAVIDYFALPTPEPDGQRRALAFAVRKDVIGPLKTLCAVAGLKLAGITPRPFGIAAAFWRAVKDGAVTAPESMNAPLAILVRGDKWGELVILRGGQVAFSRSLTGMALNSEAALLGELRRNLAVFSGPSAQNAVQALYVTEGDLPGGWTGRIRAGLSIPVQAFDPVAGTETQVPLEARGCFAGPVGLIALRARSAELPIDFLAPREPKPVSDPGKRFILVAGLAAAVLLIAGMLVGLYVADQKASEVTRLLNEKNELEKDLRDLEDVTKRVKAVREWDEKGINWLDELFDLTARFPNLEKTEVVQMVGQRIDVAPTPKFKPVGQLTLSLRTTDEPKVPNPVDTLISSMTHDGHYAVGAKTSKGSAGIRGGFRKNQRFDVVAKVERREPTQYTLPLDAVPPDRRNRRGDAKRPNDVGIIGGFGAMGGLQ